MQTKVTTPVDYGAQKGNDTILTVGASKFVLTAVVCHVGNSVYGHYISYVRSEKTGWNAYDDIHGRVSEMEAGLEDAAHPPSECGELFFYSPLRQAPSA